MLAAGIGRRFDDESLPSKVLWRFGGRTLLERHVDILRHCGVEDVTGLPSGDSASGGLRRVGE